MEYLINRTYLSVATKLVSTDATIEANMDSYVQGVYVQLTTDTDTDVSDPVYIQAVDCLEQYPHLPESFKTSLTGYMCPGVEEISLQGNLSQEGVSNTVKQFQYIVNSCDSMTAIRESFGQPAV